MTKRHTLTRRGLIGGAIAAGALPGLAMPAIGQGRAKLSVQGFGGAYEKILREAIIPEFQKLHPIDVTLTVEDDTTLLPKLRVARNRSPYDVVTVDNSIAVGGAALDLWAPDQSAKMKNAPDVYKSSMPPKTANYGSIVYEYSLVHSTEKLPKPESWKDLWKPGLVIGVPHVTQSYGLTFLYIAALLHGGDAKNLDPGFAAIKALPKFKVYKNVSEGLGLFQQKEVDAALFYGHRGQQIIDMGLPYAKAHPKEGTWGQRTGTQIPKATGNLEGAIAWVDHSLSVPYQTAFAPGLYSPTNRKVVLPPDLAKKHVMGADVVENLREVDWSVLLPQRDALIEKWTREIG